MALFALANLAMSRLTSYGCSSLQSHRWLDKYLNSSAESMVPPGKQLREVFLNISRLFIQETITL